MNKTDNTKNNTKIKEKRKGFPPALVISTIAIVVFVLWFCPKALMNARIEQTEERAAKILLDQNFITTQEAKEVDGKIELIPVKKYTDYTFFKTATLPSIIYAIPKYYDKTAKATFCLNNGIVYKKDIKDISSRSKIPPVDSTWQSL